MLAPICAAVECIALLGTARPPLQTLIHLTFGCFSLTRLLKTASRQAFCYNSRERHGWVKCRAWIAGVPGATGVLEDREKDC